MTGPKNTYAQIRAVSSIGAQAGKIVAQLNDHTFMEIVILNAIAPANGKAIRADAEYEIFHTTGEMTLNSSGNPNVPASGGLTGAEDFIVGGCIITASNNPTTHNMVLSFGTPIGLADETAMFTSVSGTPDLWNGTGANLNWVAPAVSISPIKLSPTSGLGYSGPWWDLNSGLLL